jgi:hypothetical protein
MSSLLTVAIILNIAQSTIEEPDQADLSRTETRFFVRELFLSMWQD